jgi:hypothetical protein
MPVTLPTLLIKLWKGENPTIGVSFANKGPVRGGETISNPQFQIQAGSGVTVDPFLHAQILDATFVDGGNGKSIAAGKGFRIRLIGESAVPGTYNVVATVDAEGGDVLKVAGRLLVVDPGV